MPSADSCGPRNRLATWGCEDGSGSSTASHARVRLKRCCGCITNSMQPSVARRPDGTVELGYRSAHRLVEVHMCGIAGLVQRDPSRKADQTLLQRMCTRLCHRGPDDQGFYLQGPIGLGSRRLSIIDLTTGHQPIFNESGSVALILNGEIYNFQELRLALQARRHRVT